MVRLRLAEFCHQTVVCHGEKTNERLNNRVLWKNLSVTEVDFDKGHCRFQRIKVHHLWVSPEVPEIYDEFLIGEVERYERATPRYEAERFDYCLTPVGPATELATRIVYFMIPPIMQLADANHKRDLLPILWEHRNFYLEQALAVEEEVLKYRLEEHDAYLSLLAWVALAKQNIRRLKRPRKNKPISRGFGLAS